jgi:hypothetical protein
VCVFRVGVLYCKNILVWNALLGEHQLEALKFVQSCAELVCKPDCVWVVSAAQLEELSSSQTGFVEVVFLVAA